MMKISVALTSLVVYLIIGKLPPVNHQPTRTYYTLFTPQKLLLSMHLLSTFIVSISFQLLLWPLFCQNRGGSCRI